MGKAMLSLALAGLRDLYLLIQGKPKDILVVVLVISIANHFWGALRVRANKFTEEWLNFLERGVRWWLYMANM